MPSTPHIDGNNWTVDQPYTHKRYTWENDELLFVIRDVGCSFLWRLHVRVKTTGDIKTYGRDDNGNSQDGIDGLRTLFAAAFRLVAGRQRSPAFDPWKTEEFPSLFDHLSPGFQPLGGASDNATA
jgi:hypothetical protein